MLAEGQQVELTIEKAAAGGWMIARHHGQVVLVRGAIPGERVKAWVERAEKRVAYANTREIVDASPDRRASAGDPLCGGAVFSHVAYERQLTLKGEIVQDAFARLARHRLASPPVIAGSPEDGYRMRARFHVRGARVGFYREGTHQLCDAAATRQMRPEAVEAAERIARALHEMSPDCVASIAIAENMAADQRAAHLELSEGATIVRQVMDDVAAQGLTGLSARSVDGRLFDAGEPIVADPLRDITAGRLHEGTILRHAESFFQGNRFLLPELVNAVMSLVPDGGHVVDLYAGAGLFSVPLAAAGRLEVTAVEGDRSSGRDLRENARAYAPRLRAEVMRVEDYLTSGRRPRIESLIVDPPRTGMSKEATEAIVREAPPRIVYVSCDPATLARDARRLIDGGYALDAVRGFDLFPNTAHVETLAIFERAR